MIYFLCVCCDEQDYEKVFLEDTRKLDTASMWCVVGTHRHTRRNGGSQHIEFFQFDLIILKLRFQGPTRFAQNHGPCVFCIPQGFRREKMCMREGLPFSKSSNCKKYELTEWEAQGR